MPATADDAAGRTRVRFDKWLWAARFYRTRQLAAQAIASGQAHIDGARVKPAHALKPGARVELRRDGFSWNIVVIALSDRRGSATEAAKLYAEAPESIAAREHERARRKSAAASVPRWPGRPTKRQRRKLQAFLNEA